MKIAYLHGLESSIDQKDPKIIFLNDKFDKVYTPQINYRDDNTFDKLIKDIKSLNPDLIVGSSMGGYVSYLIGSKLSIPTLLFNPGVVGRSFEPVVDDSNLKGSNHTVHLGKNDNVINGKNVKTFFTHEGIGKFSYHQYDGGHRVPAVVFINAIKNVLKMDEATKLQRFKIFEEFINDALN